MGITSFIRRVQYYHNKHGWAKLIKLAPIKAWDRINKKEYMYLLDLHTLENDNSLTQDGVVVECYNKVSDIPAKDMEQLINLKSKEILFPFLNNFFNRGATLWLAKKDLSIVSLIWSLNGGFNGFWMGMPMWPNDAIIFAGETFPEFRGRNYFAIMIILICKKLRLAGISRAYGAAHLNNKASQKAQSRIWKRIGAVRYFNLTKWHIVIWDKSSLMIDFK